MSGLRADLENMGVPLLPWGEAGCMPVSFGAPEAEYAALRRGCAILPGAHAGLIEVSGADRLKWLNGLSAQKIDDLRPGEVRRSFFLRGDGTLRALAAVVATAEALYLDLDLNDTAPMLAHLEAMLFAEDCRLRQVKAAKVSLLGPAAAKFLGAETGLLSYRLDQCGVPAFHLWGADWNALVARSGWRPAPAAAADAGRAAAPPPSCAARPIGWEAFNTARVEAAEPLFHLDFGPDSLPAETGPALFEAATHLRKGCYPGQEAVARMHNLGHPKRVCAALKADLLPEAGTLLLEPDETKRASSPRGGQLGVVTSSALSPAHGAEPRLLGVVKWGKHTPGTRFALAGGGAAEVVG